ncbi:maleylpyruvate isomerase family mycothiol-dependent enzyme [Catenuloplanes sp. NPDC051500]|uniref:maleylpyruvate isomerase family mycothiol-dependent enzyme n=1 Tax=Catenuloplanes sp. NPDC051500 TaxID=3363959 RepID=UPI0037B71F13
MRTERLRECLAADAARLREAVAGAPAAPVPTCPGWTMTDLADHVTTVYLHKVEIIRTGAFPGEDWEPAGVGLDRAYAELAEELAARDPAETVPSWYPADQTVGFWARRMAHETLIHRVDGELAAGLPQAPIPADLAVDGVDEVLVRFLEHGSRNWPDDFGDALESLDGRAVRVSTTAGGSWLVRLAPDGVTVTTDEAGGDGEATVTGDPVTVLLWLWRRGGPDGLSFGGDTALVEVLHELMAKPTL